MRRPLIAIILVLVAVAAWQVWAVFSTARPPQDLHDLGAIADFHLLERGGGEISRDDLLGKVWVAGFAFTRCAGPCPQVSGTMARLQTDLANESDFRLVSFSVDPEHDTPAVLKAYADRFGADPRRWYFVTGQADEIYRLVLDSFHLSVEPTPESVRKPGFEVTHSTRIALVDRKGHVRAYFEGRQVDDEGRPVNELPKLREAIAVLLREQP